MLREHPRPNRMLPNRPITLTALMIGQGVRRHENTCKRCGYFERRLEFYRTVLTSEQGCVGGVVWMGGGANSYWDPSQCTHPELEVFCQTYIGFQVQTCVR